MDVLSACCRAKAELKHNNNLWWYVCSECHCPCDPLFTCEDDYEKYRLSQPEQHKFDFMKDKSN